MDFISGFILGTEFLTSCFLIKTIERPYTRELCKHSGTLSKNPHQVNCKKVFFPIIEHKHIQIGTTKKSEDQPLAHLSQRSNVIQEVVSLNSFQQGATNLRLSLQLLQLLTTRKATVCNILSYRQGPVERTWRQLYFPASSLEYFFRFLWGCFHFCLLSVATLGWPPWALALLVV